MKFFKLDMHEFKKVKMNTQSMIYMEKQLPPMLRIEAKAEAAYRNNRNSDNSPFDLTLVLMGQLAIAFLEHIAELPWILITNLLSNFINEQIRLQK